MTTIEKKFALDIEYRDRVFDILPKFTGYDYRTAIELLDGVKYCITRASVFDYEDAKLELREHFNSLAE